jgi:hypothetical protein
MLPGRRIDALGSSEVQPIDPTTKPGRIPGSDLEAEGKFTLPAHRVPPALEWIRLGCDPDPEFPHGSVSSIYYDSDRWDYLRGKVDSEYLKTKVRLRWYAEAAGPARGCAFAEVKYRVGCRRAKLRFQTEHRAAWLAGVSLDDPALLAVPRELKRRGAPLAKALFPAFEVRYERRRFVERATGARVCIDYRIRAPRFSRRMLPRGTPCALTTAVFEVKSGQGDLPVTLRRLVSFGARRSAFSKYYECYLGLSGIRS